jgi:predicted amidohydrolase
VRLACLQFEPQFGRVDENLATIERLTTGRRADLIVLPELCTTGYVFTDRAEVASFAETVPEGPSIARLSTLARRLRTHLCFGIAEHDGQRLFNSAVLVGPAGEIGVYRKVHLFDRETFLFDPGDRGFPVFDVGAVRVGVMVCFDWMFPESMRTLALGGAAVIAHPSNLVLPWCQESMATRCRENRVFAATANRTGTESRAGVELRFTGASQITGVLGGVLAGAEPDGEAYIEAEIEPERSGDRKVGVIPDLLGHRRPECYATR